jgi:hypothetical protein
MQSYFSLLSLDHLASKFELFWLSGILKRFSKMFPNEADVDMFYTVVALITPGDHELTRPNLLGFLKMDGMEIAKISFKKCSPCL